ncbi:MAG: threonylcarbamoyl-AMP synthase [Deltaproteobacteria bacterium]|nr:threonylcarbamoyl-AMP synthase [Deltaproteobacteria bacterium]
MPEIITLDPYRPDQSLIAEVGSILKKGGVIAFPTETFYGLGTDGDNEEAIEKIYTIKGRSFDKPIPIIIGQRRYINKYANSIPKAGKKLMDRFWPGGLTLLLPVSPHIPRKLTAGSGKIGIRLSSNMIATGLANTLSGALTATSANISGEKECSTVYEVVGSLGDTIDLYIDGGRTPGGKGSTIVDVTVDPPVIIRKGVIPSKLIIDTLRQT